MARHLPPRTAMSEIRELLAVHHPFAYCDGCLALHLDVSLADARAAALSVAAEAGFGRKRKECYACRRTLELTAMIARGRAL